MNLRKRLTCAISLIMLNAGWIVIAVLPAAADVTLPHVIGSRMVVQRDMPAPIWGWADPDEEISVEFAGHKANARAGADGKWMVRLPAMAAGGPHTMTIQGKNTVELSDVLIGEVWLCSGQSNMEMPMKKGEMGDWNLGVLNDEQEVAAANYPQIRLFYVPKKPGESPQSDVEAEWLRCEPEVAAGFSAVAYFYGRELHRELGVPVGLINASWGGSPILPWTPQESIAQYPAVKNHSSNNESSCTFYNGMIHPLVPLAIRGAIWYQGETDCYLRDGMLYLDKMKALIGGWRKAWEQGDFPFYYVQLESFTFGDDFDALTLPEFRDVQRRALCVPETGMIVTTDISDIGEPNAIHPRNKQDVGKRLALWALAKTYGRSEPIYSGPLYQSMAVEGDRVRIRFDHVGGGLASRDGGLLTWFEIAGTDKKYVQAEAKIDGETVVVRSDAVAEPVVVRFGWGDEANPNLMNKEGLPASPFRTE